MDVNSLRQPTSNKTQQSVSSVARGESSRSPTPKIIAVLGPTGAGKSSFIRGLTEETSIVIGRTLHSETKEITTYRVSHGPDSFLVADTPGFDDTFVSNLTILRQLSNWLVQTFTAGQKLCGIIYLHPITKTRLEGSSTRTLALFDKLCGEENRKNVLLVTTFWNEERRDLAEAREKELLEMDGVWKDLQDNGAKTERMGRDYSRFKPMLARMAKRIDSFKLQILAESLSGTGIESTMAGLSLSTGDTSTKSVVAATATSADALEANKSKDRHDTNSTLEAEEAALKLLKQEQACRLAKIDEDHARELKQRKERLDQKRLEDERNRARQLQERKEMEKTLFNQKQELRSSTCFKLSKIQRLRVDDALNTIRTIHMMGMLGASIDGIQLDGVGMHGYDGKSMAVTRSPLNSWCDVCRKPFGAFEYFKCERCPEPMGICMPCYREGSGCKDRKHVLKLDKSCISSEISACRRVRWPGNPLQCDRCRTSLQGLYFHCHYCDNDDFDLCQECVLVKQRGCRNSDDHDLEWAVLPVNLPRTTESSSEMVNPLGYKYRQNTSDMQSWREKDGAAVAKMRERANERRELALIQYQDLLVDYRTIFRSVNESTVQMKIADERTALCDFCLYPLSNNEQYTCSICPNFALCTTCYDADERCLGADSHRLSRKSVGDKKKCCRDSEPRMGITCDITSCRKNIRGVYLHCCSCDADNFDVCLDCVLAGWRCKYTHHEYILKFYPYHPI